MQPTRLKVAARANMKTQSEFESKEQDSRRLVYTTTTVYQQYMLNVISKIS